jgi:hypothetical protein
MICGANVTMGVATDMHTGYHNNMISREESIAMSSVVWCDPGNHAFKAGTRGSQSMTGTEYDDNGNPAQVRMDICPEHTQKAMLLKAIDATKSEADYLAPEEERS